MISISEHLTTGNGLPVDGVMSRAEVRGGLCDRCQREAARERERKED